MPSRQLSTLFFNFFSQTRQKSPQSLGAVREICFCEILASLYGEEVDAVEDFAKQVGGPVFCYIEGGGDGAYSKAG